MFLYIAESFKNPSRNFQYDLMQEIRDDNFTYDFRLILSD
jgi:hypothetical protein